MSLSNFDFRKRWGSKIGDLNKNVNKMLRVFYTFCVIFGWGLVLETSTNIY
jgi:hypothetical protein